MKLKKGDVLKQSDLKEDCKLIRVYDLDKDYISYKLSINGKKYLVTKHGKCKPKKCNSECCKVISNHLGIHCDGEPIYNYLSGFTDRKLGEYALTYRRCKKLNRKGLCSIWKKKNFPDPCEEFPNPNDGVYVAVLPRCSFYFIIDEAIQ